MTAKIVLQNELNGFTIINDLGSIYPTKKSKYKSRYVTAVCPSCGKPWKVALATLSYGTAKGCDPCGRFEHGLSKTRLCRVWYGMRSRCDNKNNTAYPLYGGMGVSYHHDWDNFKSFMDWANNNGYADDLEIDRIDPDGNYEPSNCRFTDRKTQTRTTRLLRKTNKSGYRGVNKHGLKWRARICRNNKNIHIGMYETAADAAKARDNYVTSNNLEYTLNFSVGA